MILFAMVGFICGCKEEQNRVVMNAFREENGNDSTSYPLLIDDGKKVVYQFGKMTADKGLKVYLDTIPYPAEGWKIDDSLREALLTE